VAQAGEAAAQISSPVQDLLVADAMDIGLFVTGAVPVRRAGDGSAPVPGDGSHDWVGFVRGAELPRFVKPGSGRLVNANEPIAPPGFPVAMGRDAFGDWRARRIREMLDASNRHAPADFARMQADSLSAFARQVLPILRTVGLPDGAAARARALLQAWDGTMAMDLPQPLIFNAWIDTFRHDVLRANGIAPDQGGPVSDFVAFVLSPEGAHWCKGDCTPALRAALETAIRALAQRFGEDPTGWRWGDAHQAVFAHPFLRQIPVIGSLATALIASPGDDTTVNRGGTNAQFQSVHGAGYRGVYDLANLDRSLFMMTPGQSGHPLSRHAWDFLTRWRDGATITLGPTASVTTATLRLEP
jgi:penicillin amidase